MARGKTLLKLLDDLRAETGQSLHPGHNIQVREVQVMHLQRAQEFLWDDFAWPHLRVEVKVPAVMGQRFYALPTGLTPERLERIDVFANGCWSTLDPRLSDRLFGVVNSDLGEQDYPPRAWRLAVDPSQVDQIEIWPIANQAANAATLDGTFRFIGIRQLRRFTDDADVVDLDDQLVVLFAAAEVLASKGDKAASLKLNRAQSRYQRLRSALTKATRFQMFGTAAASGPRREFVGVYKPPMIVGG